MHQARKAHSLQRWILQADFGRRLTASLGPREALRVETWLCLVRVALALSCYAWVRWAAAGLGIHAPHGQSLINGYFGFYLLFSILIPLLLHLYRTADSAYCLTVLVIDVFFATGVTLFTGGPESSFWILWVFAIFAAAYRWSFMATMLTGLACALLLICEAMVIEFWPRYFAEASTPHFGAEKVLLRCTFLLVVSLTLGLLIGRERRLRAESTLLVRVLSRAQAQSGIEQALKVLFAQLVPLFLPLRASIALREGSAEEVFSWIVEQAAKQPPAGSVRTTLRFSGLETAVFSFPAHTWYFARNLRHPDRGFELLALDSSGKRLRRLPTEELLACLPNEIISLMVSCFSFGEDRSARLILVGPSVRGKRMFALRLLQRLMNQISPAVRKISLARNIRKEAEDQVRARLVRELHDGTIQSLLSAEMQIEVLRRQNRSPLNEADPRLTSVQNLLHREAVNLRELIEGTKPLNFTPEELPNYLTDLIIKFRRETGISVRLEVGENSIDLPPGVCHEIVRIVQEGLSNARKHSGARNIVVSLYKESEGHKLLITDDGQGFGFRGRVTQSQLDATHRGPLVIKERVRLIGGELTIDSSPGQGARLEITIPDVTHD